MLRILSLSASESWLSSEGDRLLSIGIGIGIGIGRVGIRRVVVGTGVVQRRGVDMFLFLTVESVQIFEKDC